MLIWAFGEPSGRPVVLVERPPFRLDRGGHVGHSTGVMQWRAERAALVGAVGDSSGDVRGERAVPAPRTCPTGSFSCSPSDRGTVRTCSSRPTGLNVPPALPLGLKYVQISVTLRARQTRINSTDPVLYMRTRDRQASQPIVLGRDPPGCDQRHDGSTRFYYLQEYRNPTRLVTGLVVRLAGRPGAMFARCSLGVPGTGRHAATRRGTRIGLDVHKTV
jgi:hypothetical protein